jgi:hypothetical protein
MVMTDPTSISPCLVLEVDGMAINYSISLKDQNNPFVIHVQYLSVIPFRYNFNFCVLHHTATSVTAQLLKTKALLEIRAGLRHVGNPNKFP